MITYLVWQICVVTTQHSTESGRSWLPSHAKYGEFSSREISHGFSPESVDQNYIIPILKRPSISSGFSPYSLLAYSCEMNLVYYMIVTVQWQPCAGLQCATRQHDSSGEAESVQRIAGEREHHQHQQRHLQGSHEPTARSSRPARSVPVPAFNSHHHMLE